MEIGAINMRTGSQEAETIEHAAAIFNAFGESTPSECGRTALEYTVELSKSTFQYPGNDDIVNFRIRFLAGNHLRDPLGWNECAQSFTDAWEYAVGRPTSKYYFVEQPNK